MNTTTPDYAMLERTKPGMPPKHRKLVRTYGRRTPSAAPEARSEPPTKRRRTSQDDQNTNVVGLPEKNSESSPEAEHEEEPSADRDGPDPEEELDDKEKPKSSILTSQGSRGRFTLEEPNISVESAQPTDVTSCCASQKKKGAAPIEIKTSNTGIDRRIRRGRRAGRISLNLFRRLRGEYQNAQYDPGSKNTCWIRIMSYRVTGRERYNL
ncbi:unnamed protein product [Clonostachys solani]|uniref:Uncharacterized protein n=1 Tax=Clonostachys solani TaxID=160281 RepID=A0A9N9W278_9HYPO|nr:unnamed protein product [Clonostachys solani]